MTNHQYSVALTVIYVPYILAELPSNLLLKIVGPNLMLPTLLSLWGIVTTLQGTGHLIASMIDAHRMAHTGTVKTYHGLLVCRFFLGLFEGEFDLSMLTHICTHYTHCFRWRVSWTRFIPIVLLSTTPTQLEVCSMPATMSIIS